MPTAEKDKIDKNRRGFVVQGLCAMAAFVLGEVLLKPISRRHALMDQERGEKLDSVLSDQNPTSIATLLSNFHAAPQADLMRRYVAGFTPVVLSCMATDADGRYAKLRAAKAAADQLYPTVQKDRHRVAAFPAAVAAHTISLMRDHDLQYAGETIGEAFAFPQREVQQIVSQNLVSAVTRDAYSWEHLWVSDSILEAMRDYLARRTANPLLTTDANFCVQFLCYYDLALRSRELRTTAERRAALRQHGLIEKALHEIDVVSDEYGWLGRLWRDRIREACRYAEVLPYRDRYKQLPPQSSELILGWRNTHGTSHWRDVLVAGILNHALLQHLNRKLLEGKSRPAWFQKEYGPTEAQIVVGKTKEWFRRVAFQKEILVEALRASQGSLRETVKEILENTPPARNLDPEWDPIWSLVPFRNHLNSLAPPLAEKERNAGSDLWHQRFSGGLTGTGVFLLIDLARRYFASVRERSPKEVAEKLEVSRESLEASINTPQAKERLEATVELIAGKPAKYENLMERGESAGNVGRMPTDAALDDRGRSRRQRQKTPLTKKRKSS